MKHSTKSDWAHIVVVRMHLLVIVSCLGLGLLGQIPKSSGGWVSCPPPIATWSGGRRYAGECKSRKVRGHRGNGGEWRSMLDGWHIPLLRSVALWGLWLIGGRWGSGGLVGLAWLVWAWG